MNSLYPKTYTLKPKLKSFKQALQGRVKKNKQTSIDRHTLEKATRDVISDLFGSLGVEMIKVNCSDEGRVFLWSTKSIWRSELNLQQKEIIKRLKKIIPGIKNIEIKIGRSYK